MSDLMLKLMVHLQTLRSREEGQGLVEYALIIALVSVAIVGGLTGLKDQIAGVFTSIGGTLAG